MDKLKLLQILDDLAFILEVKGENPFKVRAYRRAAQTIEGLSEEELQARTAAATLQELSGLGQALAEKISEFIRAGKISAYEKQLADFPAGLLELKALPGLGPKKIARLWREIGIVNMGMLERSCRSHGLSKLKGFGEKTEALLLQQIEQYKENLEWHLFYEIQPAAAELRQQLAALPGFSAVEWSGDFRRGAELLREITAVAAVADRERALASLKALAQVEERGQTWRFLWHDTLPVIIHHCRGDEYALRLLTTTGSEEHLQALARLGRPLSGDSETAIYQNLGLPYIPPELREGREELAWAKTGALPTLVGAGDIRGLLHIHSNYSDGALSIAEIAGLARKRGYEYVAVTDHSQSAFYAGGLKEEAVRRQWEEIDRLNEQYRDFRIFKGIEADIGVCGELDYPEKLLAGFDLVVGSIHSGFGSGPVSMTERVIAALHNPFLTWLGHPTGRLLLSRTPYAIDMEQVIEAAGKSGAMIEINAHPLRLDLDWRLHQRAKAAGVLLPLSLDAHDAAALNYLECGIGCARKGGLTAADILNTRPLKEFSALLRERRQARLAQTR